MGILHLAYRFDGNATLFHAFLLLFSPLLFFSSLTIFDNFMSYSLNMGVQSSHGKLLLRSWVMVAGLAATLLPLGYV